jgi:hypothetical protein
METIHKLLRLDKWGLVQLNIMDISVSFVWIIIFFDKAFKYGIGVKFGGYVGTNSKPLCVEFCSFVKCRIFVNYEICHY